MENTAALSPMHRPLLRFWAIVAAVAIAAALGLAGIETLGQTPGMRRTFTMMVLPYAVVAAGLICPLLYTFANHLSSRFVPIAVIAICLITGVLAGSALIGWVYFRWVIPVPRAPIPIWKFLSKELIGISLPFWIVLLSIWLWDTRKQMLLIKKQDKTQPTESKPAQPAKIEVTFGQDRYLLEPGDIQFIKAEGNYCKIHSKGRFYLKNTSLKNLEKQPYGLIRIHRSIMVNPAFISSTRSAGHGDLMVTLLSGEELKCSRNYAQSLKAALRQ